MCSWQRICIIYIQCGNDMMSKQAWIREQVYRCLVIVPKFLSSTFLLSSSEESWWAVFCHNLCSSLFACMPCPAISPTDKDVACEIGILWLWNSSTLSTGMWNSGKALLEFWIPVTEACEFRVTVAPLQFRRTSMCRPYDVYYSAQHILVTWSGLTMGIWKMMGLQGCQFAWQI